MPHERLLILGLRGRHTTILWCRDRQNTWQTELAEGKPPETLGRFGIDLPGVPCPRLPWRMSEKGGWHGLASVRRPLAMPVPPPRTIKIYDPWADAWTTPAAQAPLLLPDFKRSVVVRIEH